MKYILSLILLFVCSSLYAQAVGTFRNHNQLSGTGTNSHAVIDTFIASKGQANGVASLDADGNVIQPIGTTTIGIVRQINGTASGTVLTSVSIVSGTASLTSPILTGNVGFGTTTPSEAIHIYEGDIEVERTAQAPVINLYQNAQITGDIAQFNYRANNSANAVTTYVGIIGQAMDNTSGSETGSLAFNIYNNGSYAERMRVRGANVGIGTTTPQTRLAINGDISIQANGYANFGVGTSSNGYGVRDNSGTMQFKNNAGVWGDIASSASGGGWQDDGTNIRPITVTDTVTIGSTTSSSRRLTCVGSSTFYGQVAIGSNTTITDGLSTLLDLAIGDNDTGLKWIQDGDFALYGNGDIQIKIDGNGDKVLIGTTTSGTRLNVGGTVTAEGFSGNGGGLTSLSIPFSAITGVPTDNAYFSTVQANNKVQYGIPEIYNFPATTTAITGTSSNGRWYNLQRNTRAITYANTKLLLNMNNPGTSTFVDSSVPPYTITTNNNTIGTTTAKFGNGGGAFDGTNDSLTASDNADWTWGNTNTIDFWVYPQPTGVNIENILFSQGTTDNTNSWRISYYDGGANANKILFVWAQGTQTVFGTNTSNALTSQAWNHVRITKSGTSLFGYIDGVNGFAGTATTDTMSNFTSDLYVGEMFYNWGSVQDFKGALDEIHILNGNAISIGVSSFVPPTIEYGVNYNYCSMQYVFPGTTTPLVQISDGGTYTSKTYFLVDATTAIFGKGTTTGVLGTTTDYTVWADGAIRATAFNVASTKEIKENIETIKIKPDVLDAEAEAKEKYITDSKNAWFEVNEKKYENVIDEPGTGTVTYIDREKMESDYSNYIEFEWAADINQDIYIENIQKKYEKGFWDVFKAIKPKSWNPEDNLNLVRKGFVVEEVPDEIKGDDKRSIDPMALIAYTTLVLQSLKEELGSATAEIEKLKAIINP